MKEFIVSTDSVADLTRDYIQLNKIDIHSLDYSLEGKEYTFEDNLMPIEVFYNSMRNGNLPKTSASNPYKIKKQMKNRLMNGYDILHISFSSALSSSYNNAVICANELMEEIEGACIMVVDSLSATVGLGIIVDRAVNMKKEGRNLQETAEWIEDNKCKVIHQFIVKDLFHLVKGGRLTKTKAFVGTQLKIRPILTLNNSGEIVIKKNERGHKKALNSLVDNIYNNTANHSINTVRISHADAVKDAEYIANRIRKKYEVKKVLISEINPTIGAHMGADSIVIAYLGIER